MLGPHTPNLSSPPTSLFTSPTHFPTNPIHSPTPPPHIFSYLRPHLSPWGKMWREVWISVGRVYGMSVETLLYTVMHTLMVPTIALYDSGVGDMVSSLSFLSHHNIPFFFLKCLQYFVVKTLKIRQNRH